jgi:RHS repeat-associated protein
VPRFTGKQRDKFGDGTATGLDYFLARYYSAAQGRFTSPDEWAGGLVDPFTGGQVEPPGPLPYADIGNPQSLNKYAYVLNNPLRYTDPDGHCIPWCTAALGAAGSAVASIVSQKWSHPGQDINWTNVGISAVAGGVAGGTMGLLAAPAEIIGLSATTTLATGTAVQASAGAISGVVGGITARGLQTGDANAALGTPGQIVKDAAVGAATATVNATVVSPLVREGTQAGRAVAVGEGKIANGAKPSPSLPQRQAQLQNQQRVAGAAASAGVKTVIKKKEEEANR